MSLRFLCLGLAAVLSVSTVSLQAQEPAEPAAPFAEPEELVGPIKLPDADIDTVLGLLEIYTGRSILRPQQLPTATYRLIIDRKIPKSEAVLALETVLALNQVGVAPLGEKFLKVVALSQVKTEAPEMISGSTLQLPPSGRIATKLFQLEFLRVNEFVPQMTPLLSPGVANGVVPLDKANAALITDSISNLQRIELLIQQLDRPSMAGLTPKFYQLNYTKASDLVTKLRAMFQGPLQNQLGSSLSYNADDRTNQIVLLADPRQHALFDELIAKLDVRAEPNTRNEVIYLKHASAKDVAPLLSQLVSGQNSAAQKASGGGSVRSPAIQNQPAPATPEAAIATISADVTNEFSSFITILPDERSNSVVVSGTLDDIRLIRELVEKVDILLAQVRIEVIIAEVTLNESDKSGITALNLTVTEDEAHGTHISKFDTGRGDAVGEIAGWAISGGVVNPLSFEAALGNTGAKGNLKVLSAPTIVTTHAKEAQILVGESRPVITGSQSTPISTNTTQGSGFATSSTVTYKDIAIDLKLTPLIGDDGSIQLKIDQKVDDVVREVRIGNDVQPVIGRRQATSFINVRDGQIVVLGGMQRTAVSRQRTKLGFFFEIPVISHIFGGRTVSNERTELLLFVRPHVIPVNGETADATNTINSLSNKEQINQYLSDPSKQPKEKLIEKIK